MRQSTTYLPFVKENKGSLLPVFFSVLTQPVFGGRNSTTKYHPRHRDQSEMMKDKRCITILLTEAVIMRNFYTVKETGADHSSEMWLSSVQILFSLVVHISQGD
jgi:hypothetical protein